MANMLIESLAGDYDPDEYEDDYAQAVEALVKAKLEGGEVRQAPERKDETGEVVDLLAALAKWSRRPRLAGARRPLRGRLLRPRSRGEEGRGEEGGRQEDRLPRRRPPQEDRGEAASSRAAKKTPTSGQLGVPEGHTLLALARDLDAAFAGSSPQVSSPQGKFAEGAALLDGREWCTPPRGASTCSPSSSVTPGCTSTSA